MKMRFMSKRFEVTYDQSVKSNRGVEIIVDNKTGVNYVVVSQGANGGIGVTPLLGPDGKPIVTK